MSRDATNSRETVGAAVLLVVFMTAMPALASEPDGAGRYADHLEETGADNAAHGRETAQSARDGTFLPYTVSARLGNRRLSSLTLAGYDGQSPMFSVLVEAALFNRAALRVGAAYLNRRGGQVGPMVGLRVGILRQETEDLDLALAAGYLNRGLPQLRGEPDGEVQLAICLGRSFGRLGLHGNLVYNQGLDEEERNAEVRLAGLYALTPALNLGLDAKGHYELTATKERELEHMRSDWDVVAGPLASYAWSQVMVTAQVGVLVEQLRTSQRLTAGTVAIAGVGRSF